eukprot:CAMPEP_0113653450 /NCGR_PEP_ID=MMETSP0017_2-20120614/28590_1 /TAXON_ID=2856 /ORGANISM="Cylindrotheca closterium" /LENGTH=212 /DNA_ID=CAMNT_0000566453 /DNA_START=60 /DNA_END=695 /DNA_ORIENTATION=+ /assembly_acc=CAM_ASM_000147
MGVSSILNSSLELRSKPKGIRKKLTLVKPTLQKRKRKVQFTDVHVVEYDSPSKQQDKSDLWWTKDERKEILQNNQRLAKLFKVHHPHEIASANDAYDQCCYDDDDETSSSESEEDENTPTTTLLLSKTNSSLRKPKLHLPTHVRGLEWAILPYSKKHRKVHVQQVVEAQDDDDMAELAGSSSKACVAFARLLAQCDEPSAPSFLRRPRPRMW